MLRPGQGMSSEINVPPPKAQADRIWPFWTADFEFWNEQMRISNPKSPDRMRCPNPKSGSSTPQCHPDRSPGSALTVAHPPRPERPERKFHPGYLFCASLSPRFAYPGQSPICTSGTGDPPVISYPARPYHLYECCKL